MKEKQILICTHGRFGEELVKSAEMIIGEMKQVMTFSLMPGMDPFAYGDEVKAYIDQHSELDFLCIVDLYGGTSSNVLAAMLRDHNLQIVTGLNLGMLLETYLQLNNLDMKALKQCALTTLQNSGYDVNQQLQEAIQKKEGS